ncbi:hypothetical protein [Streptomyces milbemycinicus]|uniref:hypothetical protein n=1 Tax=Streptomyces milbemycinicus TaxID=476552 RepID=UPI000A38D365|nr:hypothetical protein [Streptomyces milbemycinicus]
MAVYLAEYTLRQSEDLVKTDLELVHAPCQTHLCDAESGDHMETLFGVIVDHAATCNARGERK